MAGVDPGGAGGGEGGVRKWDPPTERGIGLGEQWERWTGSIKTSGSLSVGPGGPRDPCKCLQGQTVQVIRIFSVSFIFILSQVYRAIFQRLCDVTWNACLCILRV